MTEPTEPVPLDLQIWDSKDCAAYLKLTPALFMRETRHGKTFPKPLKNFNPLRPRWSAKAVIDWALIS